MPLLKCKDCRWEIYFPSEKFFAICKERAEVAWMPISKSIFETVEAHLNEETATAPELARNLDAIRDQNRNLRREIENTTAELERQKTELLAKGKKQIDWQDAIEAEDMAVN